MRGIVALACITLLLTSKPSVQAQEQDVADRIRDAALNRSQVMDMVRYFTDVAGPRLTGSPNLKNADEYALSRLREWGVANAHLEAWGPFGRAGR